MKYSDPANIFGQLINNPQILLKLSHEYLNNVDFLETIFIVLGEEIKPYVSPKIYDQLTHRQIIFKNKHQKPLKYKPNITLKSKMDILHAVLHDPQTIEKLPTDEKYSNAFLEFVYIIWGDEIEPYIPFEMFEQLKNEKLMKEYHLKYKKECAKWGAKENQKVLKKKLL